MFSRCGPRRAGSVKLALALSTRDALNLHPCFLFDVIDGLRSPSLLLLFLDSIMSHVSKKKAINNVSGVPWRIAHGKWTVDRQATQIDPWPPPPVPFEGSPAQRERITRTDIEVFGTTAGCRTAMRSDLESEHELTRTPAVSGLRSVSKQLQKVQSVLDRRSEVLNEALAKEVLRSVKRTEKRRCTAWELAVPQELKDMPIPPESVLSIRRVMKAATAAASSGNSQMEDSRAVAETPTQEGSMTDESRMDVEEKRETNTKVRERRTPDEEQRRKLRWRSHKGMTRERRKTNPEVQGAKAMRERWQ